MLSFDSLWGITGLARTEPMLTNNEDLIEDLTMLSMIALRRYPITTDGKLDPRLLVALGQIAEMAKKAIDDYRKEEADE